MRELRDVLEVLVEVPVELRELDHGGGVAPLEVLAYVLPEALLPLSETVEFLKEGSKGWNGWLFNSNGDDNLTHLQRADPLSLQLEALAKPDNLLQESDRVASHLAVHAHDLRDRNRAGLR